MIADSMRRPAAALLVAVHLLTATGCHSWSTQAGNPEITLTAKPRSSVRIATTSEPTMTEILAPRVANDTLYGVAVGSSDTTAFPLDDVTQVQVQKGDAGKTTGLVVGIVGAALAISTIALIAACEPSTFGSPC